MATRVASLVRDLKVLEMGVTLDQFFALYENPNPEDVARMGEVIQRNGLLCQWLETGAWEMNKKSKWSEDGEVLTAPGLLALKGPTHIRDALLTLRMERVFAEKLPKEPGKTMVIEPGQRIPRALALDLFLAEKRFAHPKTAFRGALIFDWLAAWFKAEKRLPKNLEPVCDEVYAKSLKAAEWVYEKGGQLRSFKYQQYAFASGMLMSTGKWMMISLFAQAGEKTPTYKDFQEKAKKQKWDLDPQNLEFMERQTFGINSFELSAWVAAFSGFFLPIERSLFYVHRPYLLRKKHPDMFRLSILLSCADSHANGRKLNEFQLKWLKEIGVSA